MCFKQTQADDLGDRQASPKTPNLWPHHSCFEHSNGSRVSRSARVVLLRPIRDGCDGSATPERPVTLWYITGNKKLLKLN